MIFFEFKLNNTTGNNNDWCILHVKEKINFDDDMHLSALAQNYE